MGNLAPEDDAAGQTEPTDAEEPQPAVHGQVHVSAANGNPTALAKQLRAHLAQHVEHLNTTKDYGGHGAFGGGGSFQQGGASGANYQTNSSEGSVGDADSGPSGY